MTTEPESDSEYVAGVRRYLLALQREITTAIAAIDGTPFLTDEWTRAPGDALQGSGITQILEGGAVFERAGCGFSHVTGPSLPPSATQHRPELAGAPFEAMGVSLVLDRKSTRLNSSHHSISYAVFCLKKKKKN